MLVVRSDTGVFSGSTPGRASSLSGNGIFSLLCYVTISTDVRADQWGSGISGIPSVRITTYFCGFKSLKEIYVLKIETFQCLVIPFQICSQIKLARSPTAQGIENKENSPSEKQGILQKCRENIREIYLFTKVVNSRY